MNESVSKRPLSDIFLQHLPHDLNGQMTKGQIVSFQIPRTNHILNMSTAYIDVKMKINAKIDTLKANSNNRIGILNAATIFNTVSVISNGKTIYNDTFSQVNSRYWQMSKSEDYNRANYSSFINTEDISKNDGFLTFPINKFDADDKYQTIYFRMRIPLPSLIQCFENEDNLPACSLSDKLVLEFTLSDPDQYFSYIKSTGSTNSITNIMTLADAKKLDGVTITLDELEESYMVTDIRMITPAFIPSNEERAEIMRLSEGIGMNHGFYNYSVQAQQMDYSTERTNSLTFSSQAENIKAVSIASARNGSYCVFDKPFMRDIEVNLSEMHALVRDRVHVESNYFRGADLYSNILNGFGQNAYIHLSRLNDAVINDQLAKDPTLLLGSYFQWYKAAVGEEIGPSADSFYNTIIYKCSTQKEESFSSLSYDVSNPKDEQSLVFLSTLSFRYLRFRNGEFEIITPFPEETDVREAMKNNPKIRHGIAGPLIGGGVSLITSLVGSLRDAVRKRRATENLTNAYSLLGKDAFEYHQYILEKNAEMDKGKFTKFVMRLKLLSDLPTNRFANEPEEGNSGNDVSENTAHGVNTADDGEALRNVFKNIPKAPFNLKILRSIYRRAFTMGSKAGLNGGRPKLRAYGDDYAGAGISHGFRDWIKKQWGRFTNWIKPKIPAVIKNMAATAKKYANDILTGKISLKDVPGKLKDEVMKAIRGIKGGNINVLTDPVDPGPEGPVDRLVEMVQKIKTGRMNMSQVPKDLINQVRMLLFENNNSSHGLLVRHGILVRHGDPSAFKWENITNIKMPTNRKTSKRKIMEARVDKLYKKFDHGKPPSIKNLRKIYAMNYAKANPRIFKTGC